MRLSELQRGDKAVIVKIVSNGLLRKRLAELGFVKGKVVEVIRFAPMGDPAVYRVLSSEWAIRLDAASMIEVDKC